MTARPAPPDSQRLAFGRVAELYDRLRPPYPEPMIDAIAARARSGGSRPVVEVGAGTGIATAALARRGLSVLALEPDPEMARMLAANCSPWPQVRVERVAFERWEPTEVAAAVVSANAWHWLHPDDRWRRAHRALAAGGLLAALWTVPEWERCALRDPLREAYRALAPQLAPDFPMHPAGRPERLVGEWRDEALASGLFIAPEMREHRWVQAYDAATYPLLLRTHQDHILLADEVREPLLADITATIDRYGGELMLPLRTLLWLAIRR